ncbi:MAG: hypothetical protein DRQ40_07510 [Gammaproteobacteria bacterium]|nr:MAG: hypothetical protein DRQ40_07510 [Gammaproteobacteria bacterium]
MIETRYFIKFHLVFSIQNDFKFVKYKKHNKFRVFFVALQSRIHDNKNKDKKFPILVSPQNFFIGKL